MAWHDYGSKAQSKEAGPIQNNKAALRLQKVRTHHNKLGPWKMRELMEVMTTAAEVLFTCSTLLLRVIFKHQG